MENLTRRKKETGRKKPGRQNGPQGVDKSPGEEVNTNEPVTDKNLKGKKVDADPSREEDRPVAEEPIY